MGPTDLVLAPWRATRAVGRIAEDLNALAERARRQPDPVEQAYHAVEDLLGGLRSVIATATRLEDHIAAVDAHAVQLDAHAVQLDGHAVQLDGHAVALTAVAEALLHTTRALHVTAREIVEGGRDLKETGDTLDDHTVELIAGGRDLTETAKSLDASLRVFRAALPRLLEGLEIVEELEGAVETVADTVEPLQSVAEGVGRVTKRFGRSA